MTSRQGGALAWTSYNLPSSIVLGGSSTSFSYNADHQRWKQDANYAGTHEVTYYIGGILEKVTRGSGPTEYRHLIPAGSGAAILTRRSDATTSTYYTTSDHLGSGDLVLSSTGTVLAHESFTPFGARRGSNWQGTPTSADYTTFSTTTRRGFSGHEMLDSVGLVHMNGRVYDPLVGRFLSADPIIQTLAQSQAINPFSYVMNNPLALTDPSGLSWLSKLFHGVGHLFHSQVFRLVLAIAVAIALPYMAPALAQWGVWGAMLNGAIAGGIAAGNLTGALYGALAGGLMYGMADPSSAFGFNDGPAAPSGLLSDKAKIVLGGLAGARAGKAVAAETSKPLGSYLPGTEAGDSAAQYWADAQVKTGNPLYALPGALASLWTPDTAVSTAFTFLFASPEVVAARIPFWRYIGPLSRADSPWMTVGWKAPYGTDMSLAKDALQLPHMPTNVVKVSVPWWQPVIGPRVASGNAEFGLGGAWEYARGWGWPR